jgi:hypothetical protein
LRSEADKSPFAPVEEADSLLSPTMVLAQAQAPGRPPTADEATRPAPQPPVRDRIAPTVPPSPPRNALEPRRGSVGVVRD